MRRSALLLLSAWLLVLAAAATVAFASLRITTDLRSFMPPPANADQKLLMDQIGEGPGSRLLLLAIEGPPDTLRGPARELVRGAYKLDGRLLLVRDTDRLLDVKAAD